MFTNWGRGAAAAVLATAVIAAAPAATASAAPDVPKMPDMSEMEERSGTKPDSLLERGKLPADVASTPAVDIAVKVRRDGLLKVTETIKVADGARLNAHVPLRVPATSGKERIYSITDLRAKGAGTAKVSDGELVIDAAAGTTTVIFTVRGAVAERRGSQRVRWRIAGGFDTELASVTASFSAPSRGASAVDCVVRAAGSSEACDLAAVDHTGVLRVEQDGLAAGSYLLLRVDLPAGTVPANVNLQRIDTFANAFALTTPAGIGFAALALLLLAGAGWVVWLRRRDAHASRTVPDPVSMVRSDGAAAVFVSPDGLLPGQIGTVVDGTVDAVDVSATVIDLAVRNYIWLAEVPCADGGSDWQLSLRNPPDEQLRDFERAVLRTLFPQDRSEVLLSELRRCASPGMDAVRDAMYAEVVSQGWFASRPDSARNKLTWLGAGMAALGVLATFTLAFTVGHALLGVAGSLAGIAIAVGSLWLPGRTSRGRILLGQVRGLLEYVHSVRPDNLPPADREMVFSRCLPYAVVLGEAQRWLETFVELDPAADGVAGVYWFGGVSHGHDLRAFTARLWAFRTELDGVLAESGHLRSIRAAA